MIKSDSINGASRRRSKRIFDEYTWKDLVFTGVKSPRLLILYCSELKENDKWIFTKQEIKKVNSKLGEAFFFGMRDTLNAYI